MPCEASRVDPIGPSLFIRGERDRFLDEAAPERVGGGVWSFLGGGSLHNVESAVDLVNGKRKNLCVCSNMQHRSHGRRHRDDTWCIARSPCGGSLCT